MKPTPGTWEPKAESANNRNIEAFVILTSLGNARQMGTGNTGHSVSSRRSALCETNVQVRTYAAAMNDDGRFGTGHGKT